MRKNTIIQIAAMLLLVFGMAFGIHTIAFADAEIGALARETAAEVSGSTEVDRSPLIRSLIPLVIGLGLLVLGLLTILLQMLVNYFEFDPFKRISANFWNGFLFIVFFFVVFGYLFKMAFDYGHTFLPAASEIGHEIDTMFIITLVVTGIAFVVTHILLFLFAFMYRSKPGAKAIYYHDNHKLELLWTMIPALGLSVMILYGLRTWSRYNYQEHANPVEIRFIAEQFKWSIQLPGKDGQLGDYNYKMLLNNGYGLDSADSKAQDDLLTVGEIFLPVGRPVKVNIRAKDVLHGFFSPHFRTQIYAVPGMPTQVQFTPTITTADMRSKSGNDDFDFEIACSQICGASHWNMRVLVTVVEEAEYNDWLASLESRRFIPIETEVSNPDSSLTNLTVKSQLAGL